jgi:predicted transcriptional regulator
MPALGCKLFLNPKYLPMSTESKEKIDQVRNLYFQTNLTQAQIAELIGISQKTVSLYINDNKWKLLKQRAEQAPSIFIEQMNSELQELNAVIASRPVGQRFATVKEAEVRRKTMVAISSIKERLTTGHHTEVLQNFINFVLRKNEKDGQAVTRYADQFIKGEKSLSLSQQFNLYDLPADFTENYHQPPTQNQDTESPGNDQKAA